MTWSTERRAAQAARCRANRPWEQSTGPRTATGKARSARNSRKHGFRSAEILTLRHIMRMHGLWIASLLSTKAQSFTRTEALAVHFAVMSLPALEKHIYLMSKQTEGIHAKKPEKSTKRKGRKRKKTTNGLKEKMHKKTAPCGAMINKKTAPCGAGSLPPNGASDGT